MGHKTAKKRPKVLKQHRDWQKFFDGILMLQEDNSFDEMRLIKWDRRDDHKQNVTGFS
jgi:hypothetical protein